MDAVERKQTERYYLYYRREMALTLAFVVCMGALSLLAVLRPTSVREGHAGLLLAAGYLVLLLALQLVTLRGGLWRRREPGARTVLRDEWLREARNRAMQTAFWVMLGAQWPMMFVMAYLPPEPSVVGMGTLTVTLGLGAFLASYLVYSRQPSDG